MDRGSDKSERLNDFLIDAHRRSDLDALVRGYMSAAEIALSGGDDARQGFFLTQAWIFALEANMPVGAELQEELRRLGRAD